MPVFYMPSILLGPVGPIWSNTVVAKCPQYKYSTCHQYYWVLYVLYGPILLGQNVPNTSVLLALSTLGPVGPIWSNTVVAKCL
jgi:hypothetical protein